MDIIKGRALCFSQKETFSPLVQNWYLGLNFGWPHTNAKCCKKVPFVSEICKSNLSAVLLLEAAKFFSVFPLPCLNLSCDFEGYLYEYYNFSKNPLSVWI